MSDEFKTPEELEDDEKTMADNPSDIHDLDRLTDILSEVDQNILKQKAIETIPSSKNEEEPTDLPILAEKVAPNIISKSKEIPSEIKPKTLPTKDVDSSITKKVETSENAPIQVTKDKIPSQTDLEYLKAEYEKLKDRRDKRQEAAALSDIIQSFTNIFSTAAKRPEFVRQPNASAMAAQFEDKDLNNLLSNYTKLKMAQNKAAIPKPMPGQFTYNGTPAIKDPVSGIWTTVDGKQVEDPSKIKYASTQNVELRMADLANMQQKRLDFQGDQKDQTRMAQLSQVLSTNPTVKRNQVVVDRGHAILTLMSPENVGDINKLPHDERVKVLNSLISQQVDEIAQGTAALVSQGATNLQAQEHMRFKAMNDTIANIKQRLTADPQGANVGELLDLMRKTALREISTARKNQDMAVSAYGAGYKKTLDKQDPETKDQLFRFVGTRGEENYQKMQEGTPIEQLRTQPTIENKAIPKISQPKTDNNIDKYAKIHNLSYDTAKQILLKRGYTPNEQ